MFRRTRAFLVPLSIVLASCGSSGEPDTEPAPSGAEVLPDLKVLPAEAGGLQLFTPVIRQIPPGADITYCTYTDVITKESMRVHSTKGTQSNHGHHAVMFYAPVPHKPGTAECGPSEMENLRQMIGGGGQEGFSIWDPPENVVSEVPAGAQLVIQSHWINTSDKPVDAQAMMTTIPGPKRDDLIIAGTTAILTTDFRVKAHDKLEATTECVVAEEQRMMMTIGHEHQFGKHVKVEIDRKGGGTEQLLDLAFKPLYVFEPPTTVYDPSKPLILAPGDKVRLTCVWENDTDEALEFPREMCIFFGYSMSGKDARCVNGEWDQ